jgi:hypothetical protein
MKSFHRVTSDQLHQFAEHPVDGLVGQSADGNAEGLSRIPSLEDEGEENPGEKVAFTDTG